MKNKNLLRLLSAYAALCCIVGIIPLNGLQVSAENIQSTAYESTVPEESVYNNEQESELESESEDNTSSVTTTAPPEDISSETLTVTSAAEPDTTDNSEIQTTLTTVSDINEPIISLGDLNSDESVDLTDASLILKLYALLAADIEHKFTNEQVISADCNCSETITIEDAFLVLEYYSMKAAGITESSFEEYLINPPVITTTETTTTTTTTSTTTTTTTTSTTTASTTATTTTTTTTTVMPSSTKINVNCILQNASPALPTGCEATALTIALNYHGFSADKYDIAMNYLPRMNNTGTYGADFTYVFPGNPTSSSGYGCYAPAIVATANAYFTAKKNASYAENISGREFTDLYKYVASGIPVVFWGTMNMCNPTTGSSWNTPDGKRVTWKRSEHCLVLVGYDKSAGTVLVADPLKGTVTYDASIVKQRYNAMGKNAVIIHKSNNSKGEEASIDSGSVYRIKNAGSGLYLTVAGGSDSNGTNVIQQTSNNTASQQFRISYDKETNSYRLYTMCSSNGTNRVVDIEKIGGWVVGGSNVQIYNPVDAPAQTFVIEPQKNGTIRFSCRTNRSACLAAVGSQNGTAGGTAYSSAGNAVIKTFTGDSSQLWYLEKVN